MAVRTKLLSWRNINTDSDFSKYIETVSEPWVIEWLVLANSKIGVWKAWCPCERTNGETIYALVENFTEVSVTWPWHVIISIAQNYIDDWSLINEDWTNVATIEVVETLPSKNYLELWEMSEQWLITDKRNMIKKVWELTTLIESLTTRVNNIDERVEHLEEAWAIDHLEEQGLVWELYTMNDTMFKQNTPKLSECTVEDCKVWNTAANTEIHIQRIASWTASNKLKLKVKAVWSPTTTLKVEVRSWVQVTVTEDTEAYWYWDDEAILATWSIAYSAITTDWQELEVTLDSAVWGTKGDLLNIVCYQESSWSVVVNADNYYILACDSTQWSEAFSFVSVNGSTRTRSKLMPYCISDWFAQSLLCKTSTTRVYGYVNGTTEYWEKYYTAYWRSADTWVDDEIVITNSQSSTMTVSFNSWYHCGNWSDWLRLVPYYKLWDNDMVALQYATSGTPPTNNITNLSLPSWKSLKWRYQNNFSYWTQTRETWITRKRLNVTLAWNIDIYKNAKIVSYPRILKTLWETWFVTTLWRHVDWSWVYQTQE